MHSIPFLEGFFWGLLLSILIGPVFFALIQTSIEKGFLAGVFMAIGIALSDSLYILASYFGVSQLVNQDVSDRFLGIGGGIILIIFGISTLIKPISFNLSAVRQNGHASLIRQSVKGFLLNGINPSVVLFWISVASMITVSYKYDSYEAMIFFPSIIVTVFTFDVIKSYVANRIRHLFTPKILTMINKVVGIGLICFGLKLLYSVFQIWN